MQIKADQLASQLQQGLAPIYLVSGDEPLLVQECCQCIRERARQQGFEERELLTVESGFDWSQLYAASHSMSLFSSKRLLELRLPSAKPGDAGSKALQQLAAAPPQDTVVLIQAGKLESQARKAKWVKALEAAGVLLLIYPLSARELPQWIRHRMQQHGLQPGPGVDELLAHYFEGNLLAAAQEIERLALVLPPGEVSMDAVEHDLSDNARFTVFGWADSCVQGDAKAMLRILGSLRAEGIAPALVLWAFTREARQLAQITSRVAAGETQSRVLQALRIWPQRQPMVQQALKRLGLAQSLALLQRAARADRVLKGRLAGDIWLELECLGLAMCGIRSLPAQRWVVWARQVRQ